MAWIFVSHDTAEQHVAEVFQRELTGADVFVAGVDIEGGDVWRARIDEALAGATAFLLLCTERSVRSPWVWVEYGQARQRGLRPIPVLSPGTPMSVVPELLREHQIVELTGAAACRRLATRLGVTLADDGAAMYRALLEAASWRRVRPGPALTGEGYLVDVSHGQDRWPYTGKAWFLDGLGERPLTRVARPEQLHRGHLSDRPGLVMATPFHAHVGPELIEEVVAWVLEGGRLLLLGYQLGDRHHGADLDELARRFGVHFRADILGPEGAPPTRKPYDSPVVVGAVGEHPVVAGSELIEVVNCQSIDVAPGGRTLLATGSNLLFEPDPATVYYRDGVFAGGGVQFRSRGAAPWLAVLVQAPAGLCGKGEVLALGTWSVPVNERNRAFLTRLERWLRDEP